MDEGLALAGQSVVQRHILPPLLQGTQIRFGENKDNVV